MAEDKKSILVYADWINIFEELEDAEAGKLIKHFFRYVNDKNPESPDRLTKLLFEPIKQTLKRDLVKYENKREINRQNALMRWDKINAVASERMPSDAKHADSDSDSVSDSVSVSVSDNVIVSDKKENKNNHPLFEDFKNYALENNPLVNLKSLELKYKAWVENNWRDGNNKKIINWKSKLLNTLPYLDKNKISNNDSEFENLKIKVYGKSI